MKYKVIFVQGENVVTVLDGFTDVQACRFAISLHESSNEVHEIRVCSCHDDVNPLLVLIKK